jgi:hypothetical protein
MHSSMTKDDEGIREILKVTHRKGDLTAFLSSPESLHMPQGTPPEENLTKSKNDLVPTEITLIDDEEFLDTGLFYGLPQSLLPRYISLKPLTLSRIDIRRWSLAAPLIMKVFDPMSRGGMIKPGRKKNWKLPSFRTTARQFLAWVVLISSSVIYGGLHMLAWNASFQTKTEKILWRISAPTMMGYGVLICGFALWNKPRPIAHWGTYYHDGMRVMNLHGNEEKGFPHFVAEVLVGPLYLFHNFLVAVVSCGTLLYLLARVYLVVECFLSLFHSPPGLFRQPNWGPYFPHMS